MFYTSFQNTLQQQNIMLYYNDRSIQQQLSVFASEWRPPATAVVSNTESKIYLKLFVIAS